MHCRSDLQGRHCCHARWQQAMLDVSTASALRGLSILTGCRSVLPTGHHLRQVLWPPRPQAVQATATVRLQCSLCVRSNVQTLMCDQVMVVNMIW